MQSLQPFPFGPYLFRYNRMVAGLCPSSATTHLTARRPSNLPFKECCHDHQKVLPDTGTDCCCYTCLPVPIMYSMLYTVPQNWRSHHLPLLHSWTSISALMRRRTWKEPVLLVKNATGYDQYHKRYAPDLVITLKSNMMLPTSQKVLLTYVFFNIIKGIK